MQNKVDVINKKLQVYKSCIRTKQSGTTADSYGVDRFFIIFYKIIDTASCINGYSNSCVRFGKDWC